jgi:hypothetical protein
MGDIEEVTLSSGTKVFIKERKRLGPGIVYPIKKDLSKPFSKDNTNWKHLFFGGSILRFLFSSSWVLIILFAAWSYSHDIAAYKLVYEHPGCFVRDYVDSRGLQTTENCIAMEKMLNFTSNMNLTKNILISIPYNSTLAKYPE